VHYLDDRNINDFKKGIKENNYEFYDVYKNIPEFLFLGRSNVGKSSLINSLFHQKVAKDNKTPGKTQKIEFFLFGLPKKFPHNKGLSSKFTKIQKESDFIHEAMILDAPGFGFVDGPVELRRKFKYLIYTYLNYAVRLKQIIYLLNGEYGMNQLDKQELEFLNKFNKEIQLVFTKVDKKNDTKVIQFLTEASQFSRGLQNVRTEILLTSSRTKFGINNLQAHLFFDIKGEKLNI
jgi:GTP-binding protein